MSTQDTRSDELPTQALAPDSSASSADGMAPGERIGAFRIDALVGRGGMGEVYRATQLEPVQRTVAVKRLRVGGSGSRQAAWFEVERQVLAQMQHPNIAQLFDAGSLPDGSAYLVMEFIDGDPLTRWCRDNQVSLRQRLELFLQLLDGVQHAHQRGIIHRDLKPGNVLVTRVNGRPVPKLIDFGIAAAAGSESSEVAGTADYMSPEQADPTLGALDVRSDLFSLGVLLYELLTGERPFKDASSRAAHTRSTAPQAPSDRLREMPTPTASALMVELGVGKRVLMRLFRHELDWIVRRATATDRVDRYPSADAFAADIQAFLDGRVVQAHPPSRRYRIGRFLARHRLGVASAALVLAALLGGLATALYGLQQAREQRALAEARALDTAELAAFQQGMLSDIDLAAMGEQILASARDQAARTPGFQIMTEAQRESALRLLDLLDGIDLARGILDSQLLARAEAAIERDFASRPLLAAQLRETLAEVHDGLGASARAAALHEQVARVRDAQLGERHPDALRAWLDAADSLLAAGQRKAADDVLAHVETLADALPAPARPRLAMARAEWHNQGGRYAEAAALLGEVAGRVDADSLAPAELFRVRAQWASAVLRKGERDRAARIIDDAVAAAERALGAEDDALLEGLNAAVPIRAMTGDPEGALALSERLQSLAVERFGWEHPFSLTQLNNRAVTLVTLQRIEEAIPLLRQLVDARRRTIGTRHPQTLKAEANLASALVRSVQDSEPSALREARLGEAIGRLRQVLAARSDLLGSDHPETLMSRASLASMLTLAGQADEGLRLAEDVLDARLRVHSADQREVNNVRDLIGQIQLKRGDRAAARAQFEVALAARRADGGDRARSTRDTAVGLYLSLPRGSTERAALYDSLLAPMLAEDGAEDDPLVERLRRGMAAEAEAEAGASLRANSP